ncbi:hypothetical protein MCP_2053 [Methanocella paludicola SANAE]|uniref:Uncharacterized protein n=2 Tax=Methanocella TaxID=570266 RepID=D1Z0A3_METPS|nr:hypothetical protein MCP_2053 [Methanocella paludicola SANAE]
MDYVCRWKRISKMRTKYYRRHMPYNEEIMEADHKFQNEETVQNELALERLKLKFWDDQLKQNPGDKELQARVKYHRDEVVRLEGLVKLV